MKCLSKDLLMLYTFLALCLPGAVAVWALGLDALVVILVSVVVALVSHVLGSIVIKREEIRHPFSAMVTGMIVALSYSFTVTATTEAVVQVLDASLVVAVTSAIAVLVFKKLQGLLGRTYVNPAVAAKLLALTIIPFRYMREYVLPLIGLRTSQEFFLFPKDHLTFNLMDEIDFFSAIYMHYGENPVERLILLKEHGWLGGVSSIAVLVSALALMILCRGYIKWRIPLTYLSTMSILAASYWIINGEGEYVPLEWRLAFHVFTGSVFFLAFFMATDPPTTPIPGLGQIIFGIALGVLTFSFQIFLKFYGGAILALILMNLAVPLLDHLGIRKPKKTRRAG